MLTKHMAGVLLWWVSFATAPGADSFADRLAALQMQLAADPTNTTLLFKLGDLCHDEGANDNRSAVKLADKYLSQLLVLVPKHARALALHGSTLTMKGRDAFWPPTRISHVKAGIKEMDAAVQLAPDDPLVRFIRANNNYYMPKWLGREEIVKADFLWLWEQVKLKRAALDTQTKQLIALHQGQLLTKQKQAPAAVPVWEEGLALDTRSPTASELRKELERAGK